MEPSARQDRDPRSDRLTQIVQEVSDAGPSEEVAADFVRVAIMRGIYRPGERLNQAEIADVLGMSRIPVRAGLRHLEAENLISLHPNRGARVATLSIDEIEEIYELRTAIESYALQYVAKGLADDRSALEEIRTLADRLDAATDDSEEWVARHQRFYWALFQAAGREHTFRLVRGLRARVVGYVAANRVIRPHGGHRQLVEHLARGDVETAQHWHRAHLTAVKDRLRLALEGKRAEGTRGPLPSHVPVDDAGTARGPVPASGEGP